MPARDHEHSPQPSAPGDPTAEVRAEIWRLDHPEYGTLEYAVGRPDEVHAVDSGYPLRRKPEGGAVQSSPLESPACALLRNGVAVARSRQISDARFSVTADPPEPGEHSSPLPLRSGPRVQVRTNVVDTAVRQVVFREGRDVVHFDPPPGSAAEARLESIAASPWKRVAYPVAAGVGRSGWAIAAIVLLPLLGRILEPVLVWIIEHLPDIDIPWPEWSLPRIPWPDIALPSVTLPEFAIPGWVEFLLEYSKVWVPLLAGVVIAALAVRHSRRSREIKRRWAAGGQVGAEPVRDEAVRDEPAGDV